MVTVEHLIRQLVGQHSQVGDQQVVIQFHGEEIDYEVTKVGYNGSDITIEVKEL